jgi:hypothetical protein
LVAFWKAPAAHARHADARGEGWYEPTGQAEQLTWPEPGWKLPGAQGEHADAGPGW